MQLISLDIRDVRNIEHISLKPADGFNWFFGENGAGKTSILESISILSTGRSFRTGKISTVIRENAERLTITGEIKSGLVTDTHRLGIQRGRQDTIVRIDGQSVSKISSLARLLPCVIVSTNNHELVEGGPASRRSFLDWLVFHVKPELFAVFRRYKHALNQRNAALKNNGSDKLVSMWHPELIETGNMIDAARREIVEQVVNKMNVVLGDWPGFLEIDFSYKSGWPEGITITQAFDRIDQCRRRGITTVGPHRADLIIRSGSQESRYILSRGQQKLLAAQMRLTQIELFSEMHGQGPVVLFDDLPSELDGTARDYIFHYLSQKESQVFITSVDDLSGSLIHEKQMFHVKRGMV